MSAIQGNDEIIQYKRFIPRVHASFWDKLAKIKLSVGVSEIRNYIYGCYSFRQNIGPIFVLDEKSFNVNYPEPQQSSVYVIGSIINLNKEDDFKNFDRTSFINFSGEALWNGIKKKLWIYYPNHLLRFVMLSFADLKNFKYYYWLTFPAPSQPTVYLGERTKYILAHFSRGELNLLKEAYNNLNVKQRSFFIIIKENNTVSIKKLYEVLQADKEIQKDLIINRDNMYFAFLDPSKNRNPGWPLRIFLAALLDHCPFLANSNIKVIGLRYASNEVFTNSRIYTIKFPQNVQPVESAGWVGWECANDSFIPRLADMSTSVHPDKLADKLSDLNIKQIKWLLLPNLDVEVMQTTKCLLLGAGALGCHVARELLAWGFRHITFLDNGKVSYSNPTRQVLFNYQDCLNGGRKKAEAATDNLKLILPSVESLGVVADIPMLAHTVRDSMLQETIIDNIIKVTETIAEHDVIFLLLDTKEARWLPTLIAAFYNKITINAEVDFDSYHVIRHGGNAPPLDSIAWTPLVVPGGQLGCYFCKDAVTTGCAFKKFTPLDQQCTVARPGGVAIAGALAVELLVKLLQHPLRMEAPALDTVYFRNVQIEDIPSDLQGTLGPIPHSIKGFLYSYDTLISVYTKFNGCIACSEMVLNKYREEGNRFLLKVIFDDGTYLKEVTRLSK